MRNERPLYVLSGPVIHGEGNGRTVGMPTALTASSSAMLVWV